MNVNAATVKRSANLKSHGVFVGHNNNNSKEVVLDSSDLYYLADQLDVLDKTIQGLSLKSNASISYTYHVHKKGDGTKSSGTLYTTSNPGGCYKVSGHTHNKTGTCATTNTPNTYHVHLNGATASTVYSATNPGGCYVAGGHTHNATGTCASGYSYHEHTSACDYTVTYRGNMECTSRDGQYSYFRCDNCGFTDRSYDGGASENWGYGRCPKCAIYNYNCSGVPNAGFQYTCGSPVNTWVLGCNNLPLNAGSTKVYSCGSPNNTWTVQCGKTTSSIDEAHIVFN